MTLIQPWLNFWRTRPCTVSCPCPVAVIVGITVPPLPLFLGRTQSHPALPSITLEKVSEAKKRSVSLSASQVSSLETMLSGVCEVSSWLDWWLSTCGGFREHLPDEVRADFERLILSGSRALEFLASQGCTALGNLVLSRRDSLLAGVCSSVPAEEVARLRYSEIPLIQHSLIRISG